MPTFYSPTGNPEVWDEKPEGYFTPEEWTATHPAPAPEPPTLEEQRAAFTRAIQWRLDDFARTRDYDNILSAATYATSTAPKFQAEGQYAVEARDATLLKGYEILNAVLAGERPMPTLDDLMAELPVLAWPDETAIQP
jgi:hypothetical protein